MSTNHLVLLETAEAAMAGERFLSSVNSCSPPDLLATEIIRILAVDGPGNPRLFAFARQLQKVLERRRP